MTRTLPLVLLLSGCTATKAFVITGEGVDQVGKQFVHVSNAMQAGVASGKVSKEDFLEWAAFSSRFDVFYGRACDALRAAKAIGDDVAAKDMEAAIGRIAIELGGWAQAAQKAGLL